VDLDTFIVTTNCLIDDLMADVLDGRRLRSRGPNPILDDREVLTIEVVGEFLGIDTEKGIRRFFCRHYAEWFPLLAEVDRTTFTRQAANLWKLTKLLWRALLQRIENEESIKRQSRSVLTSRQKFRGRGERTSTPSCTAYASWRQRWITPAALRKFYAVGPKRTGGPSSRSTAPWGITSQDKLRTTGEGATRGVGVKRGPRRPRPLPDEPPPTLAEAVTRLAETMASGRQWMTAHEAAEFLRYPKGTFDAMAARGDIPRHRRGPADAITLASLRSG
jgi:hypothetical protein